MAPADVEVASVLDALQAIVPKLRENGLEAEQLRWIPDENIDLLDKAGAYRIAVPKRFGGLDFSLADTCKAFNIVSRGCGSTGWVLSAWVSGAWLATLYPEKAQEEIFAGGATRIAGGFAPTGVFTPTEGGYLLNGAWKFSTGCRAAQWSLNAGGAERPDGGHDEVLAIVAMDELKILDDWYTSSAAGTGSSTVVAENVFVPSHRVLGFEDVILNSGGDRANVGSTGRNYGTVSLVAAEAAAAYIGIARGAFELFLERIPGRGITYTEWTDQAQHPLTQIQVGTADCKLAAAEALLEKWVSLLQERADAGVQPTDAEKCAVRAQCAYAMALAKEAADILFSAGGGSVIANTVPFQRFYRDLQGLLLHALFLPNTNYELYGRVLLGLDPGTPFI